MPFVLPALSLRTWLAIAGVVAIAGGAWWLHHSGYQSGRADERAEYTAALAEAGVRYARQIERDTKVNQETVDGFENELARLRGAAPVGPVRLCWNPARPGPVPAVPALAGGGGGPGLAGGFGPQVPGRDPDEGDAGDDAGPGLQRLADGYDFRNAQVRHLLERNRKLSKLAEEHRAP